MQNGEPKPKVDGLLQAPVWGSQSTESPREVFNCLCNTCQQVDTCQSDYLVSSVKFAGSLMQTANRNWGASGHYVHSNLIICQRM